MNIQRETIKYIFNTCVPLLLGIEMLIKIVHCFIPVIVYIENQMKIQKRAMMSQEKAKPTKAEVSDV